MTPVAGHEITPIMTRPAEPSRWLHRYAVVTAVATFFLVIAGGLVTSTGSGLAVPDWPLSYGMLFPPMVGGIFYEHGHRMVAGLVGLMTVGLALWLWRRERRSWLRWLGLLAVVAVLTQAALGGITVLWFLPTPVSVGHAGLAMAFFSLMASLALLTSPGWRRPVSRSHADGILPLPRLALLTAVATFTQILVGAAVRHTGSGLACPDFPLCEGALVPTGAGTDVALQLAHRAGALLVAGLVSWLAWRVWTTHAERRELRLLSGLAVGLVILQMFLGALSVWQELHVVTTTAHVAGGALLLATTVLACLQAYRRFVPRRTPAETPVTEGEALA